MGTASLISALLLGLVGLAAILFCLRLLFSSLLGPGRGMIQRARLRYREKLAESAEQAIKDNKLEQACSLLRQAFYSEGIGKDLQLIDRLTSLNLSVLARILAIAEKRSVHLENLAVVEDLILSRSHLMKLLIEKRALEHGHSPSQEGNSGENPQWAREQFVGLYTELKDKLATNQRSLNSQLGSLFDSLHRAQTPQQVQYH